MITMSLTYMAGPVIRAAKKLDNKKHCIAEFRTGYV